ARCKRQRNLIYQSHSIEANRFYGHVAGHIRSWIHKRNRRKKTLNVVERHEELVVIIRTQRRQCLVLRASRNNLPEDRVCSKALSRRSGIFESRPSYSRIRCRVEEREIEARAWDQPSHCG